MWNTRYSIQSKFTLPIYAYRPFCGTYANNADPDQTLQNAASDQGLHCLLTESSIKI